MRATADMFTPLVDTFGRVHTYLRIAVTDRCNLQCLYCMPRRDPQFRAPARLLSDGEILHLAALFARLGVTKIRLTGGEPLLRPGIPDLVRAMAEVPGIRTLGLTTNGVLLGKYARALRAAGLTRLNVSLDTLRPDRFARLSQRTSFHDVMNGIHEALAAGFSPLKLNVVVMGGFNDDEISDFVLYATDRPVHVRFIEYMPFRWNTWSAGTFVPGADMLARLRTRFEVVPVPSPDGPHAVARDYRIEGIRGMVSFISSMSDHFCDGCNRIRLTADGSVKSCLFHPAETCLRDLIRNGADDAEIVSSIRKSLQTKPLGHEPAEQLLTAENRAMIDIGG